LKFISRLIPLKAFTNFTNASQIFIIVSFISLTGGSFQVDIQT